MFLIGVEEIEDEEVERKGFVRVWKAFRDDLRKVTRRMVDDTIIMQMRNTNLRARDHRAACIQGSRI